ncbi:hypothetical protein GXW82_06780 [Streptacidiphilus sp. 4-A2]|nr:hypothetical protein [Streptacidiphilus sp. 4-A2]
MTGHDPEVVDHDDAVGGHGEEVVDDMADGLSVQARHGLEDLLRGAVPPQVARARSAERGQVRMMLWCAPRQPAVLRAVAVVHRDVVPVDQDPGQRALAGARAAGDPAHVGQ